MMPVVRGAGIFVAALLATLALYIGCALLLGAIPRNTGFVESENGIPVYVRTNGVHAELILPDAQHGVRLERRVPGRRTCGRWPRRPNGSRLAGATAASCSNTPTWSDLRPSTAIVALSGAGSGAMHVEYIETPTAYKSRRVRLSQPNTSGWWPTFALRSCATPTGGCGRSMRRDTSTPMRSTRRCRRYTFWYTCNEWTRRALAAAGVRTAMWAPFDTAVFYHLPDASKAR